MTGTTETRTRHASAFAKALLLSSAFLLPTAIATATAQDGATGEEEITVTAQRKAEKLQKVPIAVSAFGQDQLQKQKIDGGPNLVLAVPNVNFSKGNFTGSNFQIRGIGSKLVAASGDAATGIHINNAPMVANNLFETEFYDVERVEVLRGPQGTLYGRNATGGVVNIITAKPKIQEWEAMGRAEYGNFSSIKLRGMVNVPLGEMAALRVAGSYLKRGGFGVNTVTGNDADDRLLYGIRGTLFVQPTEDFSFYVMFDHFNEDDHRSRIGKQFCSKDTGPASVGGQSFFGFSSAVATIQRGFFSQGCKAVSLYDPTALGTVNSQATLGGLFGTLGGFQTGDAYAGKMQDPNIRNIESSFDPIYRSSTDIWEFNADWDITNDLRLSALATYTTFDLYTRQDYNRYTPSTTFNTTPNPVNALAAVGAAYPNVIYPLIFPAGVVNDPQNGPQNRFTTSDISSALTKQYTAELRLQSNYDGPFNFSLGANWLKFDATGDYYIMFNTGTAWYQVNNFLNTGNANCFAAAPCVSIDPNVDPDRSGRNYYDSYSPYELKSTAFFGEVYYQITDELKFTLGARYTDDKKHVDSYPVTLGVAGRGLGTPILQNVEFKEWTGRAGFDWNPDFGEDVQTLIYGFVSRGYKSGGLNSPCSAGAGVICGSATFAPEFITSYELGTKNTFGGGMAQLNLSIFKYDYEGYQVSKIVNRASTNENIDAKIQGAEFEGVLSPVEGLRFNLNVGYLETEIKSGVSIDTFNRTQSNPLLTVVKSSAASNCVVTTAAAAQALFISNGAGNPAAANPFALLGVCTVTNTATAGQQLIPGGPVAVGSNAFGALVSDGVPVNLAGKELPNAPKWTISFGAQYTIDLSPTWSLTVRGDYYKQTETFSRIWNASYDRIDSWENLNFTVTLTNPDQGFTIDAYVKNATDETAITDSYLTDDSSGLFRNAFFTDPRTYGLAVTVNY